MDETDMTTEELMQRWETGGPVELIPSILVLLRSIDAQLKVLVQRSTPINVTINSEPVQWTTPYYPWTVTT